MNCPRCGKTMWPEPSHFSYRCPRCGLTKTALEMLRAEEEFIEKYAEYGGEG